MNGLNLLLRHNTASLSPNGHLGDPLPYWRKLALAFGGLVFWLLYAGYFVYHFLAARDVIPKVLGGLFGPVVAVALPFLVLGAIVEVRKFPVRLNVVLILSIFLVLAWSCFWLGIHYAVTPDDPAHAELATTLSLWVGMLALAFNVPLYSPLFQKVNLASLLVIGLLALAFINDTTLMIDTVSAEGAASYQGMARSLMVIGFIVLSSVDKLIFRAGVATYTIVALFFIGARSELYGFIAAYFILESLLARKSLLAQLALVFVTGFVTLVVFQNLDLVSGSRQLEVLDLSRSTSWIARKYMSEYAQNQILSSPIWGVYGGHWQLGEGAYAHNLLSAWVSLGLFGFVLIAFQTLLAAFISLGAVMALPHSRWAKFSLLINLSVVLLFLVAKPVFWEIPALGWALALIASRERRARGSAAPPPQLFRYGQASRVRTH